MALKVGPKKRASKQAARRVAPSFDPAAVLRGELELSERFQALRNLLDERGEQDGVDVLWRLEFALLQPDDGIAGQTYSNRGALSKMARIGGTAPNKKKGPPRKRETETFAALVRYVEASRVEGKSDATIAVGVVWGCAGGSLDRRRRAPALIAGGELGALVNDDAERFVRNVYRALGHPRPDQLTNAKSQRNSRSHKAKDRARSSS